MYITILRACVRARVRVYAGSGVLSADLRSRACGQLRSSKDRSNSSSSNDNSGSGAGSGAGASSSSNGVAASGGGSGGGNLNRQSSGSSLAGSLKQAASSAASASAASASGTGSPNHSPSASTSSLVSVGGAGGAANSANSTTSASTASLNSAGNSTGQTQSRASGFLSSLTGGSSRNNAAAQQQQQQQRQQPAHQQQRYPQDGSASNATPPGPSRIGHFDAQNTASPPIVVVSPENVSGFIESQSTQAAHVSYACLLCSVPSSLAGERACCRARWPLLSLLAGLEAASYTSPTILIWISFLVSPGHDAFGSDAAPVSGLPPPCIARQHCSQPQHELGISTSCRRGCSR